MNVYAVILASGTGSRMKSDVPKQFYKIEGKTIIEYSISAFQNSPLIDKMIIVSNPDFISLTKEISKKFDKVTSVVTGGNTRQESSFAGISQIKDTNSKVLIHDAVRPFVSNKIIEKCIHALDTYKAVNVAVDSSDTIIQVDNKNIEKKVFERSTLRRCQTPQGFDYNIIKKAHEISRKNNDIFSATDDCGLVLKYNLAEIFVVEGSEMNIKITYPNDLKIAEEIIKQQQT